MGEQDGIVRQVRGRPRPPMTDEELLEFSKIQFAALGLKGPIYDYSGKIIGQIPERPKKD